METVGGYPRGLPRHNSLLVPNADDVLYRQAVTVTGGTPPYTALTVAASGGAGLAAPTAGAAGAVTFNSTATLDQRVGKRFPGNHPQPDPPPVRSGPAPSTGRRAASGLPSPGRPKDSSTRKRRGDLRSRPWQGQETLH